jgi:hypothetical protein
VPNYGQVVISYAISTRSNILRFSRWLFFCKEDIGTAAVLSYEMFLYVGIGPVFISNNVTVSSDSYYGCERLQKCTFWSIRFDGRKVVPVHLSIENQVKAISK